MLSSEAGLENIAKINLGANAAVLQDSSKLCKMFQLPDGVRLSQTEHHLRSKLIQDR